LRTLDKFPFLCIGYTAIDLEFINDIPVEIPQERREGAYNLGIFYAVNESKPEARMHPDTFLVVVRLVDG
jgi:hypothetical protein